MVIIYATQRVQGAEGCRVVNPRLFSHIVKDASRVIIVGAWPKVERAYRNAGIGTHAVAAPGDVSRHLSCLEPPPVGLVEMAKAGISHHDPLDHDGDGEKGGSLSAEARGLDDLRAKLENAGVKADRRWGESRLRREIDALPGDMT
jgi:hypothetical protein